MNKKQILSWCLFDFANSSYSAVIAAAIFPVYFANVIVGNRTGEGDLWWGRAISLSMLTIALSSPFLGGIADYAGLRKKLLALYTLICVAAVSGFSPCSGVVIPAFILVVCANIGMEGGLVFYNSFLPRIAPASTRAEYRVGASHLITGRSPLFLLLCRWCRMVNTGTHGSSLLRSSHCSPFLLPFLPADVPSGLPRRGLASEAHNRLKTLKTLWHRKETKNL
jgi:MFS-type transporter involved in bile tolerance (Atg22 family)